MTALTNCTLFLEFLGKTRFENCCCLSVPMKQCFLGQQPTCSGISLCRCAACCLWNQFLWLCLLPPDRYRPNALLLVCWFGSIGVKWPGVVSCRRTLSTLPNGCRVGSFALRELFRDVCGDCVQTRC